MKEKGKNKKKTIDNQKYLGFSNYTVGDFLARIKNACLAKKKKVEAKNTKLIKNLALALKKEGFLKEVKEENQKIKVTISYRNKQPLIFNLKLVSKPGLRIYKTVEDLEKIKGPSVYFLTTSKGVMSAEDAIKKGVGGEVIAEVL